MRPVVRLLSAAGAMALAALAIAPAAPTAAAAKPPAGPVFTLSDPQTYEYRKDCSTQEPFPCTTTAQNMYVHIWTPTPVGQQFTFTYVIEPITATAGVDYIGTSGTVVMAARTNFAGISFPLINDGVVEPSETLRVRLTSSSGGGNISDVANGTILNDGQIPRDCTLSRPSLMVTSLSCTDRPATQSWYLEITCYDSGGWGYVRVSGATVTGNGTSTATCTYVDYDYGSPIFYVRP